MCSVMLKKAWQVRPRQVAVVRSMKCRQRDSMSSIGRARMWHFFVGVDGDWLEEDASWARALKKSQRAAIAVGESCDIDEGDPDHAMSSTRASFGWMTGLIFRARSPGMNY